MHTNFRWNTQFILPSHNNNNAPRPKSRTFFQSALFVLGCLLLIGLFCIPSLAQPINVSDQKPGSLLVFPYYNTQLVGGVQNNTRIAISNTDEVATVFVHLFVLEGATCTPSDFFVCLTANGGITMFANDIDPLNVGYIIAVAVSGTTGFPIAQNSLIGNAFVNATIDSNLYVGNYAAESFAATGTGAPSDTSVPGVATLQFNGGASATPAASGYDQVASQFAVQIQNANTVALGGAPGQRIVTAGLSGNMTIDDPLNPGHSAVTGAGQVGTGRVISQNEIPYSFTRFLLPGCHSVREILNSNAPRLSSPLASIIGANETGLMKFGVGGAVGLIMTPQSTNLATQRPYVGIRALHKTATVTTTLTIPTFVPPSCSILMGN